MSDLICPFCGDKGFDLPGLAGHFTVYRCDEMQAALAALSEDHRKNVEIAVRVAREKTQAKP